jgi:hypothetical protein
LGLGILLGGLFWGRSLLGFSLLGRSRLLRFRLLRFRLLSFGLLLGLGLRRLLGTFLLLASLGSGSKLEFDKILTDGDSIFLIHKELLDGTRLRGIDRNINLASDRKTPG